LNSFDILIIGGGPAGLFTALNCTGRNTLVLEKNSTPGKKLLISGSGRCNVTHEGEISDFLKHYGENHKFLKTALRNFTNQDLIGFLKKKGLETMTDKNGKIFPDTGDAADILQILLRECRKNNVTIYNSSAVYSVKKSEGLFHVKTQDSEFTCHSLVISTGGNSYPETGSSGDGYQFAKMLGHAIIPPKPALTPVFIRGFTMAELAGVSLQNKSLYLYRENKKINEQRGDIGFTHKGLSGPGILDFSRHIHSGDVLKINLIDMNADEFRQSMIGASAKEGRITLQLFLRKYDLPRSLVKIILQELKIEPDLNLANVQKNMRNQLVSSFCEYPYCVEKTGGFNMAMTTKGGVSLSEVSSKTMESKLVPHLYFAGEVLDVDGDTGGYNIQAAFSTGKLAATAILARID
jgi:predicted Rossmann fold flavoprotein